MRILNILALGLVALFLALYLINQQDSTSRDRANNAFIRQMAAPLAIRYGFAPSITATTFELLPGQARRYNIDPKHDLEFNLSTSAANGINIEIVPDDSMTPLCAESSITSAALRCELKAGHNYMLSVTDNRRDEDRQAVGTLAAVLSRGRSVNLAPNPVRVSAWLLTRNGSPSLYLNDAPRPALP